MNNAWEYMLVVNAYGVLSGEVFYILPTGERKKYCGKDMLDSNTVILLNELGEKGWEIIGVTDDAFGGPATKRSTWTLRRNKQPL